MGKNTVRKIYTQGQSDTWQVPGGVKKVKLSVYGIFNNSISAGYSACLFLDINRSAYNMGDNDYGELGDGTVVPKSSPVAVSGGHQFIAVKPRQGGFLFLKENGDAYSIGNNSYGSLGDGTIVTKSTPTLVIGGLKFKKIASNNFANLGLTYDGKLYSWGENGSYQLGDGTNVMKSSPVLVLGANNWGGDIDCSDATMVALDTGGYAWTWGNNANGGLGVGDVTNRSSPTPVVGSIKFKSISAGKNAMIGIDNNNDAWAWGANAYGQLGLGDTTQRSSPIAVLGGLKWKKISFGNYHAVGLTLDGIVYTWGRNNNGQLGLGDTTNRSSPTILTGATGLTDIVCDVSAGGINAKSLCNTVGGKLYAWGYNNNGELGDGTVVPKSSPVAVLGSRHVFSTNEKILAEQIIDVVPGNYVSVNVNDKNITFGPYALYGDSYHPVYLVMEYEA